MGWLVRPHTLGSGHLRRREGGCRSKPPAMVWEFKCHAQPHCRHAPVAPNLSRYDLGVMPKWVDEYPPQRFRTGETRQKRGIFDGSPGFEPRTCEADQPRQDGELRLPARAFEVHPQRARDFTNQVRAVVEFDQRQREVDATTTRPRT